jgi:hypothetical protein
MKRNSKIRFRLNKKAIPFESFWLLIHFNSLLYREHSTVRRQKGLHE